jgi:hypothetical protein
VCLVGLGVRPSIDDTSHQVSFVSDARAHLQTAGTSRVQTNQSHERELAAQTYMSGPNASASSAHKASPDLLDALLLSMAVDSVFSAADHARIQENGKGKGYTAKQRKRGSEKSERSQARPNRTRRGNAGMPLVVAQTVHTLSSGQDLRGVIDAYGVAWAVRMSKNSMQRKKNTNWFFGNSSVSEGGGVRRRRRKSDFTYKKIEFELDLKLLRYSPEDKFPAPIKWSKIDKKKPGELLVTGWQTKVRLSGWWQDNMKHFRGEAKPIDDRDKNWLAWALVPWETVDIRFDANGATFFIEWRPGNGAWFKFARNGNSGKPKSTSFRLDARLDLKAEELWTVYKSGQRPFRVDSAKHDQEMLVMTMNLYEWKKDQRFNGYTGAIYMRLLGLSDKYGKAANSTKWGNYTPETDQPWFIFAGEEGSWKCVLRSDDELLNQTGMLQYTAVQTGTSCLADYSDEVGTACPWLERIYPEFDVKLLGKLVIMRPTNALTVTKQKGGGIFSSPTIYQEKDDGFYPLYPIYNDHLMANWGKNVKTWPDTEQSMSVDDFIAGMPEETEPQGMAGTAADSTPMTRDEASYKRDEQREEAISKNMDSTPMVQVPDMEDFGDPDENEQENETRRQRRQLKSKEKLVRDLTEENEELLIYNEALETALQVRQKNLTSASASKSQTGTGNMVLTDRYIALSQKLDALRKERAGWLGLCPGWETNISNGRPYYFNRATGASSWTKPTCGNSSAQQHPYVANKVMPTDAGDFYERNTSQKPAVVAVPHCPGWESTMSNGRPYYFNRATE